MPVDVSAITYFAPLIAFLIVWVVMFAVLSNFKVLGDNKFIQTFISLLIAALFVSVAGVREYVLTIIPWFAVLIISTFFILALTGFIGTTDAVKKGVGAVFLILLVVVFLVSAIVVFSGVIGPYLPGSDIAGGESEVLRFTDWIYSPRVAGAISLIVVSALVAWVLVRVKKE